MVLKSLEKHVCSCHKEKSQALKAAMLRKDIMWRAQAVYNDITPSI